MMYNWYRIRLPRALTRFFNIFFYAAGRSPHLALSAAKKSDFPGASYNTCLCEYYHLPPLPTPSCCAKSAIRRLKASTIIACAGVPQFVAPTPALPLQKRSLAILVLKNSTAFVVPSLTKIVTSFAWVLCLFTRF